MRQMFSAKRMAFYAGLLTLLVLVWSMWLRVPTAEINHVSIDLDSVKKRGKLIALTDFNSTDYFIYKGEPMGFNFELLNAFSQHIGVNLEIVTENDPFRAADMLRSGSVDIMAIGLPASIKGLEDIRFSEPVDKTKQVLVKRRHGVKQTLRLKNEEMNTLRDELGLGKNTIYIHAGIYDAEVLSSLAYGMGDSINILEAPYDQERLVQYVSQGLIDYTVCDENVAIVNSTYYPNLDISVPAGPVKEISFAFRKRGSDSLVYEFNRWITSYRKSREYAFLHAEYFRNSRSGIIVKSSFYALYTGRISAYDDLIRKYSSSIDWDWRLIASIIYQESRFNPDVCSGAGAYGLMQVMPSTGDILGIDVTSSPENNIRAGIKYINYLHTVFDNKIPDEKERINFILAAYNGGPGHVLDAMKLAEKNGMNPLVWEGNVEVWMLRKSRPEYYNDEVVKNGYFKGVESVNFVSQVLERYNHYRNIVPEHRSK